MARYYLIRGYRVPHIIKDAHFDGSFGDSNNSKIKYFKKSGIPLPVNYTFIKISSKVQIKIIFCNIDVGFFLIKAPSRREAYYLLNAVKGFYSIFYGWEPPFDEDHYSLYEINKIPQPHWLKEDLISSIWPQQYNRDILKEYALSDCVHVDGESLKVLKEFLSIAYNQEFVIQSMSHLRESRRLFYGFMTGSYYHYHYKYDRRSMRKWELEKKYLEMRYRYEISFTAAFKGIESLLGVNDIKKHEVKPLLEKLKCPQITYDKYYTRHHEVFLGYKKKIKYGELIEHFLNIRNVVAAHNNKRPPREFNVSEDNLIEIQLLLHNMIALRIDSLESQK